MGTYLLGMILHLRFKGHWVFAGIYETAAHYYALHLVRHLEATVVCVVELSGVVSPDSFVSRELEFKIRAKHATVPVRGSSHVAGRATRTPKQYNRPNFNTS
jgi:putative Ca2+/H+ antiporter (TMEM165/GDT1 family)